MKRTLLLFALLLSGCAREAPPPARHETPAVDSLLRLMRQRLLVMHDVARWKWQAGKPITDAAREQAILDALADRGREMNLPSALVRDFFAAQIRAATLVQEEDFRQWKTRDPGSFDDVPDLASELRPRIDRLNRDLLLALAQIEPSLSSPETQAALRQRVAAILVGVDAKVRDAALEPLLREPGM